MSFLEPRISFSLNFALFFSVMRHGSSILLHLKLCMLWGKRTHQSVNFQTFDCLHENEPNSLSFFKPRVSFPLNFASPLSVMAHNSYEFSTWTIICIRQKEPIKVQFFRLLSALIKFHPISHAIFKTTRSGFFLAQTLYTFDKKIPSKRNFQTFEWLCKNSRNSSCQIWNHKSVFLKLCITFQCHNR